MLAPLLPSVLLCQKICVLFFPVLHCFQLAEPGPELEVLLREVIALMFLELVKHLALQRDLLKEVVALQKRLDAPFQHIKSPIMLLDDVVFIFLAQLAN